MKNTLIAVLLLVTGVAVGTAGVFLWPRVVALQPGGVVCTADAMQCPDGSYVGRTGPRCEFAPCPPTNTNQPPAGWITKRNGEAGVSFLYPSDLGLTYMRTEGWPPVVTVTPSPGVFAEYCEGPTRHINGHVYCVSTRVEGAAGTAYTEFSYWTMRSGRQVRLEFTIAAVACANYEEPKLSACREERDRFDLDDIVDRIAQSVRVD